MCPGPGPSAHTHTHKTRADQADIAACRQTAHLHLHAERVKVGIWLIDVNCMHQLHRWWKWKTWMAEIGTRTRVIRVRMILRSAIQRTKWLHWFHFFWFAQLDLQSHAKVPTCSVLRSCSNSFQLPVAGAYWLLWISVHVQLGCKHTHTHEQHVAIYMYCIYMYTYSGMSFCRHDRNVYPIKRLISGLCSSLSPNSSKVSSSSLFWSCRRRKLCQKSWCRRSDVAPEVVSKPSNVFKSIHNASSNIHRDT